MSIDVYCKKELILFSELTEKEAVLELMSGCLLQHGYTKDSYHDAIVAREKVYPTGLSGERLGIAIPHTDIVHVIRPAICICIFKNPVEFQLMGGDENETVQASVVFMLALKEPEKQLEVLQLIATILENDSYLKSILQCNTPDEVLTVLKQIA
jgi:PTS system galactitol-specific IIA component